MTAEDSTLARIVEIFNDSPNSLDLQDEMTYNLTAAIPLQSKMEADIETLNVNLNQLFLLINGSLVILMQVNFKWLTILYFLFQGRIRFP